MTAHAIQEQTVQLGEIELHVATAGEPATPALVFLHGLYDRWETWDSVMRAFAAHYRVVAPDLRGHARSSKPRSNYDPNDYAGDVTRLLDELELPEVVVVGHSLGAFVGEYVAADYPDRVSGLIMVDPPFEQNEQTREWLEILLDAKRGSEEHTYETVREMNILLDDENEWRRQTDWLRATADGPFEAMIAMIDEGRAAQLYEVLRRVTCPTLILRADQSSGGAVSQAACDLALEHLRDGTCRQFDDTGHAIHLERPDEFVTIANEFLVEIEARASE